MKSIVFLVAVFSFSCASAAPKTFTTDAMIVTVENGSITRIYNKLTGTEYINGPAISPKQDTATGLVYTKAVVTTKEEKATVVGPTPTAKGATVLAPVLVGLADLTEKTSQPDASGSVSYVLSNKDGDTTLSITYSLDPATGDLLVRQKGWGTQKGLAGVRFGVGPITCDGSLLLPALAGIKAPRADGRYQFESPVWQWPTGWQLPLIVFDHPGGGLWIHSEDTERRFKTLSYRDEGTKGIWSAGFETDNTAPFAEHDSVESVTWHLNTYAGKWTVPVDRYRKWAYQAFHMDAKAAARPSWVDDIQLIIKHADYLPEDQVTVYLDALAKLVNPRRTLLFMTNWVDGSKGLILPYWVASQKGIRFNTEARKRGFRTMYFANYIGITPNHPRFADFKPYVVQNPYSQELEGWNLKSEWTKDNPQLYYVSPALKAWRDYDIGQFRELFAKHPADGLFIDQAFLMFNDGKGLRDGQTTVDGNLAYHAELSKALPGVAIGGESINEITMQYESFCEIHPLSLHMEMDPTIKALNWKIEPGAFERMVPLLPRFLLPHTRPIGYLGFPDTNSPYYPGWRDSLMVYQGIPTITRPRMAELEDQASEVRRVIRMATHE